MSLDIPELPMRGKARETDSGLIYEADQYLANLVEHLANEYGWVAVLDILWQKIRRYDSGPRYARYLIGKWRPLPESTVTVSYGGMGGNGGAGGAGT